MENAVSIDTDDFDLSEVLEIPEPAKPPQPTDKFVIFQAGEEYFAVPAIAVKEVSHPMPVTPLPNSPVWLHGLSNLRGEIIAILNFSHRSTSARISPKSKVVVFRSADFDIPVGFLADRIAEIVPIAPDSAHPADEPGILGKAMVNGVAVNIVDTERWFSSIANN